jgi:hypothetical protein
VNTLKWHDLTKEPCVAANYAPVEDEANSRTASRRVSARQLGRSSPRTAIHSQPVAIAKRPAWISGVYNSDSARHYGFIPNKCVVVPPQATAGSVAGIRLAVGLTRDRSYLPCRFICYCGRNVNGTPQNECTRSAVLDRPVALCCGYLRNSAYCISGDRAVQCFSLGCIVILDQPRIGDGRRGLCHTGSARVFRSCLLDFPGQNT